MQGGAQKPALPCCTLVTATKLPVVAFGKSARLLRSHAVELLKIESYFLDGANGHEVKGQYRHNSNALDTHRYTFLAVKDIVQIVNARHL